MEQSQVPMKVVYVLTLGKEIFCETLLLSMYSLRFHNPGCEIEVVLDTDSLSRVSGMKEVMPASVKLIGVDIPTEFSKNKSRYLKTKLRFLVEGDYLYLDTDTVVAGDISAAFAVKAELAAVADGNGPVALCNATEARLCLRAGIESPLGKPYYNGGVMLVRNSPVSFSFYEKWHTIWRSMLSKGIGRDQMALMAANMQCGQPIKELSGVWNCQVSSVTSSHYFRKAKIVHYFTEISDFAERFVRSHVNTISGLDEKAQLLAERPLAFGRKMYNRQNTGFLYDLWGECLYLSRHSPRLYSFLKTIPNRLLQ